MTTLSHPYECFDVRTSPKIRDLILRAASTAGVSLSAFLSASAQDARAARGETANALPEFIAALVQRPAQGVDAG